jgi:23S rRNA-/tRNA-specific pseudouridylate synthase
MVIARQSDRQLVRLWPQTGRTHQLRLHMAAMLAPILGDRLYGDAQAAPRLLLHARRLSLPAIEGPGAYVLAAPLPPELAWPGVVLDDEFDKQ